MVESYYSFLKIKSENRHWKIFTSAFIPQNKFLMIQMFHLRLKM